MESSKDMKLQVLVEFEKVKEGRDLYSRDAKNVYGFEELEQM